VSSFATRSSSSAGPAAAAAAAGYQKLLGAKFSGSFLTLFVHEVQIL